MSVLSFFFSQIIAQINSSINGKIQIVEQFGRCSIRVDGIEQSGPIVEGLWQRGLIEVRSWKLEVRKVLILGLGGGSAVKLINKYYPKAKIVGVEIDPAMVNLGKKYLKLGKYKNLQIKIVEAFSFVSHTPDYGKYFDLVLVDLYIGKTVPEKIESKEFLRNIKKILTDDGIVIFNRLRSQERKGGLDVFFGRLKENFAEVKVIKPLINRLFICS